MQLNAATLNRVPLNGNTDLDRIVLRGSCHMATTLLGDLEGAGTLSGVAGVTTTSIVYNVGSAALVGTVSLDATPNFIYNLTYNQQRPFFSHGWTYCYPYKLMASAIFEDSATHEGYASLPGVCSLVVSLTDTASVPVWDDEYLAARGTIDADVVKQKPGHAWLASYGFTSITGIIPNYIHVDITAGCSLTPTVVRKFSAVQELTGEAALSGTVIGIINTSKILSGSAGIQADPWGYFSGLADLGGQGDLDIQTKGIFVGQARFTFEASLSVGLTVVAFEGRATLNAVSGFSCEEHRLVFRDASLQAQGTLNIVSEVLDRRVYAASTLSVEAGMTCGASPIFRVLATGSLQSEAALSCTAELTLVNTMVGLSVLVCDVLRLVSKGADLQAEGGLSLAAAVLDRRVYAAGTIQAEAALVCQTNSFGEAELQAEGGLSLAAAVLDRRVYAAGTIQAEAALVCQTNSFGEAELQSEGDIAATGTPYIGGTGSFAAEGLFTCVGHGKFLMVKEFSMQATATVEAMTIFQGMADLPVEAGQEAESYRIMPGELQDIVAEAGLYARPSYWVVGEYTEIVTKVHMTTLVV